MGKKKKSKKIHTKKRKKGSGKISKVDPSKRSGHKASQLKFFSIFRNIVLEEITNQGEGGIDENIMDWVMKKYDDSSLQKKHLLNGETDFMKGFVAELNRYIGEHNIIAREIKEDDERSDDESDEESEEETDEEDDDGKKRRRKKKKKKEEELIDRREIFPTIKHSTTVAERKRTIPEIFRKFTKKHKNALIQSIRNVQVLGKKKYVSIVAYCLKIHDKLIEKRKRIETEINDQHRPNIKGLEILNNIMKNPKMKKMHQSEEFQLLKGCLEGNKSQASTEDVPELKLNFNLPDPNYSFSFPFSAVNEMKNEKFDQFSMEDLNKQVKDIKFETPSVELVGKRKNQMKCSVETIKEKETELKKSFENHRSAVEIDFNTKIKELKEQKEKVIEETGEKEKKILCNTGAMKKNLGIIIDLFERNGFQKMIKANEEKKKNENLRRSVFDAAAKFIDEEYLEEDEDIL